jgi:hypothetical protein
LHQIQNRFSQTGDLRQVSQTLTGFAILSALLNIILPVNNRHHAHGIVAHVDGESGGFVIGNLTGLEDLLGLLVLIPATYVDREAVGFFSGNVEPGKSKSRINNEHNCILIKYKIVYLHC